MTTFFRSSSSCISSIKVGLMLAFLVGQMPVQAALKEPDPPDHTGAGPVVVSTDKVKNPNKQRQLKRGPTKPETYATKPQQQIPNLR